MTPRVSSLTLTTILALVCVAAGASPVLDSDNFESYSEGELSAVSGSAWSVVQGSADVQSTVINEGVRAVRLQSDTVIDRSLAPPSGESVVFTQSFYRGAGTDSPANYPPEAASSIVHFSSGGSVAPGVSGPGIFLADGDGSGGTTWMPTAFDTVDPGVFYEITIRQDYNAMTWDCWIDGSLEGQDLGFRDVVNEISGIRVFAGVESYFDTFLLRENNLGDIDESGQIDAADVVRNVNLIGSSPQSAGTFPFIDADQDRSNSVDASDVSTTVDQVLN
jgi:hypothetical protein